MHKPIRAYIKRVIVKNWILGQFNKIKIKDLLMKMLLMKCKGKVY